MSDLNIMIQKTREIQSKAYAPYSNFKVGACIKTNNNNYYLGCNVENASYGLALCAEGSAIAAMIAQGETRIDEIAVMGMGTELCSPCGACRQRIREFSTPNTLIHICGPEGLRVTTTIEELLPKSFGPENLLKTTK